jgi:hypothetical protein
MDEKPTLDADWFDDWWTKLTGGRFRIPQFREGPPRPMQPAGPALVKRLKKDDRSSRPTRTFKYGAREPTENAGLVDQQFRLANGYRNALVEVELQRRDRIRVAGEERDRRHPEFANVQAQIEVRVCEIELLRQGIADRNQCPGGFPPIDLNDRIARLENELSELMSRLNGPSMDVLGDRVYAADIRRTDDETNARRTALRVQFSEQGLHRDTCEKVEQSVPQRSPDPPQYHRWDGTGTLVVQTKTDSGDTYLTPDEVLRGDSDVIRIEQGKPSTEQKKPSKYSLLRLRIGTGASNNPVWATVSVKMHRQLPPDTYITAVSLVKTQDGKKFKWETVFTLARPGGRQGSR